MAEKLTPQQRFDYIWSRVKQHAENIDMGVEELAAILISATAQSLATPKVKAKLADAVATFINDYLAAKERPKLQVVVRPATPEESAEALAPRPLPIAEDPVTAQPQE